MRMADDIEVLVLTWNRVPLLREALGSLLRQTVAPRRIVVIDNASEDDTQNYVNGLVADHPHVHLVRQPMHVDFCSNMMTAVASAESRYFMVMHDDDLLDRNCVACLDKVVARFDDVSMVCSAQRSFHGADGCVDLQVASIDCEVFRSGADFVAADFARFLRRQEESLCFPSVLYRRDCVSTEVLKRNAFGKIVDKPFVYGSMGTGRIVRLGEPLYNYRTHDGQDTKTSCNGPYPEEILSLLDVYRQKLSANSRYAEAFKALSIRLMKSLYFWGGNGKGGWHGFVEEARARFLTGAMVDRPWRIPLWRWRSGKICEKMLQCALGAAERCAVRLDESSMENRK